METANLISKKQIRDIYESYTDYFNEIMAKVIERLQQNIKLSAAVCSAFERHAYGRACD